MRSAIRTVLLLSLGPAAPLAAQRDAFVMLRGTDTIAVEVFRRLPGRLDVDLSERVTRSRITLAAERTPAGLVRRLENQLRRADAAAGSPPQQQAVLTFARDSVTVDITGPAGARTLRLGTKANALPYVNPSTAMVELLLQRARTVGGDSASVPLFYVAGGMTIPALVRWLGTDSAVVSFSPGQDFRLAVDAEQRILGGSVPSQGLRIVRTTLPVEAVFLPPPDYSAPAGAPYTATDVTVPTPMGHTLAGTLTVPNGRGRWPAIVTISGSGSQDRDEEIPIVKGFRPFRQIADTLGRMGVAALRMDDRGFGLSGGNAATSTSADFAQDIAAGVAYLRARADIDPDRIFLVGHSEGGMIAPMVAAADPRLRGIVLMAGPAQTGRQIIRFQNAYAIERNASIRPEARDSALGAAMRGVDSIATTNPWIRFFLDHDPVATAKGVRIPVLVLQGATDMQVTAGQAEALGAAFRRGGNRDVTVRVFPEINHLFLRDASGDPSGYGALPTGSIDPEVIGALTEWLRVRASRR